MYGNGNVCGHLRATQRALHCPLKPTLLRLTRMSHTDRRDRPTDRAAPFRYPPPRPVVERAKESFLSLLSLASAHSSCSRGAGRQGEQSAESPNKVFKLASDVRQPFPSIAHMPSLLFRASVTAAAESAGSYCFWPLSRRSRLSRRAPPPPPSRRAN